MSGNVKNRHSGSFVVDARISLNIVGSLSRMLRGVLGHDHIKWHPLLIRHCANLQTCCRARPCCRFWPYYLILEVSMGQSGGCGLPTEDACSSGRLVLSSFGLAFVLMLGPIVPELVMSTDLLNFEHPSLLQFCFTMLASILIKSVSVCIISEIWLLICVSAMFISQNFIDSICITSTPGLNIYQAIYRNKLFDDRIIMPILQLLNSRIVNKCIGKPIKLQTDCIISVWYQYLKPDIHVCSVVFVAWTQYIYIFVRVYCTRRSVLLPFWSSTSYSDLPTNPTLHILIPDTNLDLYQITTGCHGSVSSDVASQQGTLTFLYTLWNSICSDCWGYFL